MLNVFQTKIKTILIYKDLSNGVLYLIIFMCYKMYQNPSND